VKYFEIFAPGSRHLIAFTAIGYFSHRARPAPTSEPGKGRVKVSLSGGRAIDIQQAIAIPEPIGQKAIKLFFRIFPP
jgi:hypothetical protein